MNHKPQPALIALVLLSTGLLASQVHAHGVTNQPLGAAVGATDYYQVKCANTGTGNAARLEVQIRDDTAGAALLSAQVQKGLFAVNTQILQVEMTTTAPWSQLLAAMASTMSPSTKPRQRVGSMT